MISPIPEPQLPNHSLVFPISLLLSREEMHDRRADNRKHKKKMEDRIEENRLQVKTKNFFHEVSSYISLGRELYTNKITYPIANPSKVKKRKFSLFMNVTVT